MKNKIIGTILIVLSLLTFILKNINENKNIIYQNKIINDIKDNHNEKNEYIGYIEIPKYNIKRLIKNDVSDDILDDYFVGKMNINNRNLTVLAGHNINLVFHKLHYLNRNDIVYINDFKVLKKYKVINKKEVMIDNYSCFKKDYKKDTLILITCTYIKNKRLIVLLENIG